MRRESEMNLREAAQQALEALEKESEGFSDWLRTMKAARTALRDALAETASQESRQVEPVVWLFQHEETGLTECVDAQQVEWGFERNNPRWQKIGPLYTAPPMREHMAEIHRLRVAGRQALEALELGCTDCDGNPVDLVGPAITALRAALEPVTDCHEKEGDKLSPPLERKDLSEESLNELVEELKNLGSLGKFKPTHMLFDEKALEYCKKLAEETSNEVSTKSGNFISSGVFGNADRAMDVPEIGSRNIAQAVDSTEADHIVAAYKMMANVREDRTVEPVAYISGYHKGRCIIESVDPNVLLPVGMALYRSRPMREPLTDEMLWKMWVDSPSDVLRFARAIEQAHGIGGEE